LLLRQRALRDPRRPPGHPLERPLGDWLSGKKRFHSPWARAFAFQFMDQRHRLPAVTVIDLRE
jgi:hypothetical protein